MNTERCKKVIEKMDGMDELLICDPAAIYYLTDQWFHPGERFLALLIRKDTGAKLFLNTLFPCEQIKDLDLIFFNDSDDFIQLLRPHIDPSHILGVDKNLPSRFLLPMIQNHIASDFINGSLAVDKTRAIKDAYEIKLMRKSSQINDAAMYQFKQLVREGISEKQIAMQMLDIYKKLGAEAYSFEPIVAFGINAADPHHMPDDTKLQIGDTVLFDVGCKYHGYCSDMTRTFFFQKYPDKKKAEVYHLVRKANEDAKSMVQKGIRLCDIDHTARKVIEDGGYGKYFTHRLGHFIGIEDHEYGDVSSSFEDLAQVGNIFSIEPGIYDPSVLGCRIEDLVLVTEDGCEVLNHYPHEIEVIG